MKSHNDFFRAAMAQTDTIRQSLNAVSRYDSRGAVWGAKHELIVLKSKVESLARLVERAEIRLTLVRE